MWWAWLACSHEEPLSGVEAGRIGVTRSLDPTDGAWGVRVDVLGDDDRCLGLSRHAGATLDGEPLALTRGGWGYDAVNLEAGCAGNTFSLDALALDAGRDTSALRIEDRGTVLEVELPHVALPHTFEAGPIAAGQTAEITVSPAHPDLALRADDPVFLASELAAYEADVVAVDGLSATFVAPDVCAGGAWDLYPPRIAFAFDAGPFAVDGTIEVAPGPVEVDAGDAPPPCPTR